jgi:hypothetical protein
MQVCMYVYMYVCGSGLTGCGAVRGAHVFECLHVDHVHQHPTLERVALVRGQLVRDRLQARQQVVLVVKARHFAKGAGYVRTIT